MFRAVPLPIIRNFPLYIRHWYMSCRFYDSFQARQSWSCLKAVNLYSNTFYRNKSITHSKSKGAIFPAQLSLLPRKMTHITTDTSFWLTTDWKEMVYDASRFSQSDTTFVRFSLVAAIKICCASPKQSRRTSLVLSCLALPCLILWDRSLRSHTFPFFIP
jgi:hypothetical protein